MKFHKISVEVSDDDASKIKQFLMKLGDIRNSVSVKKSEGSKDQNISFYTFSIESDVLKDFAIRLKGANLKVVTQDEINDKLRSSIQSSAAYNSAVATDISPEDLISIKRKKTIQDFVEGGQYEVLLDMIRNIQLEKNKRDRAEFAIPATVKKAIELYYEDGISSKRRATSALEGLVSIATNVQLKNLRINHILENAGYKAIEVCLLYSDYADELIKISNNIKIPYIVSIKAVVKFAELTLRDDRNFRFEYEADVNFAAKNTNLRWLKIAYDAVENEFTDDEKKQFEKFMSFIEYKKLGH